VARSHSQGRGTPFNKATYDRVWSIRRFQDFVLSKARNMDDLRARVVDEAGKA
jgi:hypothetical protein